MAQYSGRLNPFLCRPSRPPSAVARVGGLSLHRNGFSRVSLDTPIGKCFQLEIVSFLQGRLGTCPYPKYPVGARRGRAQNETIAPVRHLLEAPFLTLTPSPSPAARERGASSPSPTPWERGARG
ncbi:MAG: hypothetical protein NZ874_09010 [Fimbriimonadales bacterium]|nr:hypothetical protein [Fimbriimonadales bacterium]